MRFWTSDIHFGHRNIIEYCQRPFDDPDQMNAEIIERWNETVQPEDTVMVLGDVALGKIVDTLPLVMQLNGIKSLVPGNHDRVWSGHKKNDKWLDAYSRVGFNIMPEQIHVDIAGVTVNVCHFPYEGDSHDADRYVSHRPIRDGKPLLHGHVHDKWSIKNLQYNVGMDVHDFRPVAESEIEDWVRAL